MKNNFTLGLRLLLILLLILFLTVVLSTCGGGSDGDNVSTISGSVILGSSSGLAGVTLTLSGSPSTNTVSDSIGNYAFNNISNGSYVITPSLDGYTFSPVSRNISISGANVSGVDFDATFTGYKISGIVTSGGSALSGVSMTLGGDSSSATTSNGSGSYEFSGLLNGSYSVTPSLSGYIFSPTSSNISISGANVGSVDFDGVIPKNVIIFIGDGMGFEHVKAAGMYANGSAGTLSFEGFPNQSFMTTGNFSGGVTDSAASSTAMATGFKVNNNVVSMLIPGNGSELKTLLEDFKDLGWSTGLVTTSFISDATPATFGAHEPDRNNLSNIVGDYLNDSKPNVLFGGATSITQTAAQNAGYTVVLNRSQMQALNTDTTTLVSGQFGSGFMPFEFDGLGLLPHLREMTATALDILDNDPDGFFLLVEDELTDNTSHSNDIQRAIFEVIEISNAVQVAIDWAAGRNDTLIIVTSDHETGGLTVTQNNGQGNFPTVSWSSTNHTLTNVPVYASGANADLFTGVIDNTDVHDIISQTFLGTP